MRSKRAIGIIALAAVLAIGMAVIGKIALKEKEQVTAVKPPEPLIINTVKYKHIHVYDSEGTVLEGYGEVTNTPAEINIKLKEGN